MEELILIKQEASDIIGMIRKAKKSDDNATSLSEVDNAHAELQKKISALNPKDIIKKNPNISMDFIIEIQRLVTQANNELAEFKTLLGNNYQVSFSYGAIPDPDTFLCVQAIHVPPEYASVSRFIAQNEKATQKRKDKEEPTNITIEIPPQDIPFTEFSPAMLTEFELEQLIEKLITSKASINEKIKANKENKPITNKESVEDYLLTINTMLDLCVHFAYIRTYLKNWFTNAPLNNLLNSWENIQALYQQDDILKKEFITAIEPIVISINKQLATENLSTVKTSQIYNNASKKEVFDSLKIAFQEKILSFPKAQRKSYYESAIAALNEIYEAVWSCKESIKNWEKDFKNKVNRPEIKAILPLMLTLVNFSRGICDKITCMPEARAYSSKSKKILKDTLDSLQSLYPTLNSKQRNEEITRFLNHLNEIELEIDKINKKDIAGTATEEKQAVENKILSIEHQQHILCGLEIYFDRCYGNIDLLAGTETTELVQNLKLTNNLIKKLKEKCKKSIEDANKKLKIIDEKFIKNYELEKLYRLLNLLEKLPEALKAINENTGKIKNLLFNLKKETLTSLDNAIDIEKEFVLNLLRDLNDCQILVDYYLKVNQESIPENLRNLLYDFFSKYHSHNILQITDSLQRIKKTLKILEHISQQIACVNISNVNLEELNNQFQKTTFEINQKQTVTMLLKMLTITHTYLQALLALKESIKSKKGSPKTALDLITLPEIKLWEKEYNQKKIEQILANLKNELANTDATDDDLTKLATLIVFIDTWYHRVVELFTDHCLPLINLDSKKTSRNAVLNQLSWNVAKDWLQNYWRTHLQLSTTQENQRNITHWPSLYTISNFTISGSAGLCVGIIVTATLGEYAFGLENYGETELANSMRDIIYALLGAASTIPVAVLTFIAGKFFVILPRLNNKHQKILDELEKKIQKEFCALLIPYQKILINGQFISCEEKATAIISQLILNEHDQTNSTLDFAIRLLIAGYEGIDKAPARPKAILSILDFTCHLLIAASTEPDHIQNNYFFERILTLIERIMRASIQSTNTTLELVSKILLVISYNKDLYKKIIANLSDEQIYNLLLLLQSDTINLLNSKFKLLFEGLDQGRYDNIHYFAKSLLAETLMILAEVNRAAFLRLLENQQPTTERRSFLRRTLNYYNCCAKSEQMTRPPLDLDATGWTACTFAVGQRDMDDANFKFLSSQLTDNVLESQFNLLNNINKLRRSSTLDIDHSKFTHILRAFYHYCAREGVSIEDKLNLAFNTFQSITPLLTSHSHQDINLTKYSAYFNFVCDIYGYICDNRLLKEMWHSSPTNDRVIKTKFRSILTNNRKAFEKISLHCSTAYAIHKSEDTEKLYQLALKTHIENQLTLFSLINYLPPSQFSRKRTLKIDDTTQIALSDVGRQLYRLYKIDPSQDVSTWLLQEIIPTIQTNNRFYHIINLLLAFYAHPEWQNEWEKLSQTLCQQYPKPQSIKLYLLERKQDLLKINCDFNLELLETTTESTDEHSQLLDDARGGEFSVSVW